MARTAVAYVPLVANSSLLDPAGTTYDVADGMIITAAKPEHTILKCTNTDDDTGLNVVVKAGDYPPAWAAGQGDLTVTVAFGTTRFIGPFESGRFLQSDGSMHIDATVNTGKITPLLVPAAT